MIKWNNKFTGRPPTDPSWVECRTVFQSLFKTPEMVFWISLADVNTDPAWKFSKSRDWRQLSQDVQYCYMKDRGEAIYCRLGRQSAKAFQLSLKAACDLALRPLTERRLHQQLPPSACLNKRKEALRKRELVHSDREACGLFKGKKLLRGVFGQCERWWDGHSLLGNLSDE